MSLYAAWVNASAAAASALDIRRARGVFRGLLDIDLEVVDPVGVGANLLVINPLLAFFVIGFKGIGVAFEAMRFCTQSRRVRACSVDRRQNIRRPFRGPELACDLLETVHIANLDCG